MFEEAKQGTAEELLQHFTSHPPKGEFVILIASNKLSEEEMPQPGQLFGRFGRADRGTACDELA